jgi:hypothetical protein
MRPWLLACLIEYLRFVLRFVMLARQGFWIPPLGLLIKRRTGSTLPLFAGCALANWVMNLLFARFVSMEDGRTILARRDRIAAEVAEAKESRGD